MKVESLREEWTWSARRAFWLGFACSALLVVCFAFATLAAVTAQADAIERLSEAYGADTSTYRSLRADSRSKDFAAMARPVLPPMLDPGLAAEAFRLAPGATLDNPAASGAESHRP